MTHAFKKTKFASLAALLAVAIALAVSLPPSFAQPTAPPAAAAPVDPVIAKIRDEGFNRSQVMQTLSYLTDVIGTRLTGSPNLKHANEWTRDKLTSYGLVNAHLEPWQFGRGWAIKHFSLQVVEPQDIPLIAWPKAWSPGLDKPVTGEVVYLDARTETDLQKYEGKLKGAIVLNGGLRPVTPHFEPQGVRMTEEDLAIYTRAQAGENVSPAVAPTQVTRRGGGGRGRGAGAATQPGRRGGRGADITPATQPTGRGRGFGAGGGLAEASVLAFLMKEGAAVELVASSQGDGGTIFGGSAALPAPAAAAGAAAPVGRGGGGSVYAANSRPTLPQAYLAVEDYNRLVRIAQQGVTMKMDVDFQVQYFSDDLNAYNTIAEIPGTDLKDEIVMLGGHMDSWHMGTGATDNGTGVSVSMEAVRILKALDIKPRRTIRIALWAGEEEGLLGSRAYVTQHFGSAGGGGAGRGGRGGRGGGATTTPTSRPAPVRLADYDKLSCYFNFDNGAGKIRGIFAQSNPGAAELFKQWLVPFADLGASTVSLANTGSTDHMSFDAVGLPGFQFIQDPLEYMARSHHSTADVYDRIPADDMKEAAVLMAAFVYDAAMADHKMPRKGN